MNQADYQFCRVFANGATADRKTYERVLSIVTATGTRFSYDFLLIRSAAINCLKMTLADRDPVTAQRARGYVADLLKGF